MGINMDKEIPNTAKVAELVHAEPHTVANLALRGKVPATSIGKGHIFFREVVLRYVRAKVERDTAELRAKRKSARCGPSGRDHTVRASAAWPRARPSPALPAVPQRQAI